MPLERRASRAAGKTPSPPARRAIEAAILELLRERDAASTACPSEVARALDADGWRPLMQPVRAAAAHLAQRGMIEVLQRGRVVDIAGARGPLRLRLAQQVRYAEHYRGVDFRAQPERYRVGKGEQGVLVAEPYKSELLPLWRFATPSAARASAAAIWKRFLSYRDAGEGPGMDMARKFLQMGFTRARRYANHAGGKKYDAAGEELPRGNDPGKAQAAEIFHRAWQRAERDRAYRAWRASVAARPPGAASTGARSAGGASRSASGQARPSSRGGRMAKRRE